MFLYSFILYEISHKNKMFTQAVHFIETLKTQLHNKVLQIPLYSVHLLYNNTDLLLLYIYLSII